MYLTTSFTLVMRVLLRGSDESLLILLILMFSWVFFGRWEARGHPVDVQINFAIPLYSLEKHSIDGLSGPCDNQADKAEGRHSTFNVMLQHRS
jgi:hypothetical protein